MPSHYSDIIDDLVAGISMAGRNLGKNIGVPGTDYDMNALLEAIGARRLSEVKAQYEQAGPMAGVGRFGAEAFGIPGGPIRALPSATRGAIEGSIGSALTGEGSLLDKLAYGAGSGAIGDKVLQAFNKIIPTQRKTPGEGIPGLLKTEGGEIIRADSLADYALSKTGAEGRKSPTLDRLVKEIESKTGGPQAPVPDEIVRLGEKIKIANEKIASAANLKETRKFEKEKETAISEILEIFKKGPSTRQISGPKFVKNPRSKNDTAVEINVSKFDEAFKKDKGFYVGKGAEGGMTGRYTGFKEFLKKGEPIEMPEVHIDENGVASFTNGRHRYAVLRDMGLPVKVTMEKEGIANAKKFGLIKYSKKPSIPK